MKAEDFTSHSVLKVKQINDICQQTITNKIQCFLNTRQPSTPFLVVDLDTIDDNYLTLHRLLPQAQI